jgi:[ribosomal protein S5]-alanine N-acetyltransferase
MQYIPFPFSHTVADSQQSLAKILNNPNEHLFAALTEKGDYMGMGGIAVEENGDCGVMGYSLLPIFWGQGHASFIAKWLIGFGFSALSLQVIRAVCDIRNVASITVLEKNGMTKEILRKDTNREEGVYRINFDTTNNSSH